MEPLNILTDGLLLIFEAMMHPKDLSIKDFTYSLPAEMIAKYPLMERDQSKLLVYKHGVIESSFYAKLDEFIPANATLIFNNTKVVEARLLFKKATGTTIELFCLEPGEQYVDITTAMLQKEKVLWKCLVGGAKKWKEEPLEKPINYDGANYLLSAKKLEKINDYYLIEFSWNNASLSFAELLHLAGAIPLPPYMQRDAEENDKERYQTIYAKYDGSVAAPTAGLHFTEALFDKLAQKNIKRDYVTLHVGAGTFKPVKAETMEEHEMHAEFIEVSRGFIEILVDNLGNSIIAVGTTSMRTLESLYWLGVKAGSRQSGIGNQQSVVSSQKKEDRIQKLEDRREELNTSNDDFDELYLNQWEAYDLEEKNIPAKEALHSLLAWMHNRNMEKLVTKTQIIIAPGYRFKIVKGLITNFHQPQSTLLLLVAALVGDDWKKIYNYALANDFRFLSYGDGCLLRPAT